MEKLSNQELQTLKEFITIANKHVQITMEGQAKGIELFQKVVRVNNQLEDIEPEDVEKPKKK